MPDDTFKHGKADQERINVHEAEERKHWAKKLGVSEDRLRELVKLHGPMVKNVKKAAMNIITGANLLGYGFNVLSPYSERYILKQIFIHQIDNAQTFTYPNDPKNGITYAVPDNISTQIIAKRWGSAYSFADKHEVQSHFASDLHASLSVNWGLSSLSGQFDSSFSTDQETMQSSNYGAYEYNFQAWQLNLESTETQWLADDFVAEMNALPNTFDPANPQMFFEFFGVWGTHYVNEVIAGARLYYYFTVKDSFSSDEQHTHQQIDLEFKAAFTDDSGGSSKDWDKLDQNWATSRSANFLTVGGDDSLAGSIVNPGDNFNKQYSDWTASVDANVAGIDFQLTSISSLFTDPEQQSAVAQALDAFTNANIFVSSAFTVNTNPGDTGLLLSDNASQVFLSGTDITPEPATSPPPPYQNGFPPVSFILTILDGYNLGRLFDNVYYLPSYPSLTDPSPTTQIYQNMYDDLVSAGIPSKSNYIVVLTGAGLPDNLPPSGKFAEWLNDCGASWALWIGSKSDGLFGNYVCVGQQGLITKSANAPEYFADVTSLFGNFPETLTTAMSVILYPPLDEGEPYSVVSPFGDKSRSQAGLTAAASK